MIEPFVLNGFGYVVRGVHGEKESESIGITDFSNVFQTRIL